MMSSGRRNRGPAERRPRFFKIIHSSIIQDRQLAIPTKFVSEFGKELSDVAVLEAPNGNAWKIRLRKASDGKVWFQRGWQEFVEYHSIDAGHFLVFRYEGNSQFFVLIFDMSGSEIEYPGNSHRLFEEPNHNEKNLMPARKSYEDARIMKVLGVDNNLEHLKDAPEPHYRNRKLKHKAFSCLEKRKRSEIGTSEQSARLDICRKNLDSSATLTRIKSIQEDRKIDPAVEAFKSDHPFFFVVMRPAYVSGKFALNVPFRFLKTYVKYPSQEITLVISSGKTWVVRCYMYKDMAKIYLGWEAFIRENSVKEGDTCVFELIKEEVPLLKVSIFRVAKEVVPMTGSEAPTSVITASNIPFTSSSSGYQRVDSQCQ